MAEQISMIGTVILMMVVDFKKMAVSFLNSTLHKTFRP